MGLLDGGGAALLASVFSPIYRVATLRKVSHIDDDYGGVLEAQFASNDPDDHDIKVQRHEMSSGYRTQANIPVDDIFFIVLLPGATATPETGDRLLWTEGTTTEWRIAAIVSRDPTGASMVIRCAAHD